MPKLRPKGPAPTPPADVPLAPRVALSVPEAAASTGLSVSTLYELMKANELPFVKVRARRIILVSALETFLAGNTQGPRVA